MDRQKMEDINQKISNLSQDQKFRILRAMFGLVDINTSAEEAELAARIIETLRELGIRTVPQALTNCIF